MYNAYKCRTFIKVDYSFMVSLFLLLKSSQPGSKSQSLDTLNSQAYVVPFKATTINEAFSSSMAGKLNHNPTATPQ